MDLSVMRNPLSEHALTIAEVTRGTTFVHLSIGTEDAWGEHRFFLPQAAGEFTTVPYRKGLRVKEWRVDIRYIQDIETLNGVKASNLGLVPEHCEEYRACEYDGYHEYDSVPNQKVRDPKDPCAIWEQSIVVTLDKAHLVLGCALDKLDLDNRIRYGLYYCR